MPFWQDECTAARKRFLALEEGLLGPDEAASVRGHVGACDACGRAWQQWQADDRALREALRPVRVPRDVAGATLAALRRGAAAMPAERPRRVARWAGALAAAAALLVVAGVLVQRAGRYQLIGRVESSTGRPMARQRGARFASVVSALMPVYSRGFFLTGREEGVSLHFSDGSRVVLEEGTEVGLSCIGEGGGRAHRLPHVCLQRGEVLCELKSLRHFRAVGTPLASAIAAAGATFRVKYVPGARAGSRTCLRVLEGEVAFSSPDREVRAWPGSVWVVEGVGGVPRLVPEAAWAR